MIGFFLIQTLLGKGDDSGGEEGAQGGQRAANAPSRSGR